MTPCLFPYRMKPFQNGAMPIELTVQTTSQANQDICVCKLFTRYFKAIEKKCFVSGYISKVFKVGR